MKKNVLILSLFGVLSGTCLYAQEASRVDVFAGYSYLLANPAQNLGSFHNDGGVGNVALNLNDNFGMEFEYGGYYNGNVNKTTDKAKTMTFLVGPRASLGRSREFDPYVHVLFGGVYTSDSKFVAASGVTSSTGGTNVDFSEHSFAMAAGGGLDIRLSRVILFRPIQFDYLLTRLEDLGFSGQPVQARSQHNLRVSAGFVFQFGRQR
jgi:hypothetical protein